MKDFSITVGETGPDWEPTPSIKYYAAIEGTKIYTFGSSTGEALRTLAGLVDTLAEQFQ